MALSPTRLEKNIEVCLQKFYASRLTGLQNLSLKKVLQKKNPYLYRALGIEKASEIVEQIMAAFVTSSCSVEILGGCSVRTGRSR